MPNYFSKHPKIETTFHDVHLSGLPDTAVGTRIAHLTDIHRSSTTSDRVIEAAVAIILKLKPDVILITGDFVSFNSKDIAPCAELLAPLEAKLGVFAILGNHDYTSDSDQVKVQMSKRGIRFLINKNVALLNGLVLAGIDDDREGKIDLVRAFEGIDAASPTVTMIHNPTVVERIADRNGLVLAGHTHGGQVNLPMVVDTQVRRIGAKHYKAGWYRLGKAQLYVNRGIGQVLIPFRINSTPEVALFTLQNRSSATEKNKGEMQKTFLSG